MFRNIRLPRSGLVDISRGGTFTCLNCHFSNVSISKGIVDKGHNADYASYQYSFEYELDTCLEDLDDHDIYDISLDPAPEEAVLAYGSDYVVANATIRDCMYLQRWAGNLSLPECPQHSIAERRARLASASQRDKACADPTRAHDYRQGYVQQEGDRDLNRRTPSEYNYDCRSQMPLLNESGSAYTPSPLLDMSYAEDFMASLGEQLLVDHPWLQAVMRVCFSSTASVCVDRANSVHTLAHV